MNLEELRQEAARVRALFLAAAAQGEDGSAHAKRYEEIQRAIAQRLATGAH